MKTKTYFWLNAKYKRLSFEMNKTDIQRTVSRCMNLDLSGNFVAAVK